MLPQTYDIFPVIVGNEQSVHLGALYKSQCAREGIIVHHLCRRLDAYDPGLSDDRGAALGSPHGHIEIVHEAS